MKEFPGTVKLVLSEIGGNNYKLTCTSVLDEFTDTQAIVFRRRSVLFSYAVVALGNLHLSNVAEIHGNVLYKGEEKLSVPNNFVLKGNLIVEKAELELSNNAVITGNVEVQNSNLTMSNNSRIGSPDKPSIVKVKGKVVLNNNSELYGDVYAGGNVENSGTISGQIFANQDDLTFSNPPDFPPPEIPDNLPSPSGELVLWHREQTLTSGTYSYSAVKVQEKGKLIVDTSNGDVILRVGELNVDNNGTIEVKGSNNLIIYVDQKVTFSNNAELKTSDGGKVFIVSDKDNVEISFSNNSVMENLYIYAPGANVTFSNNASFKGSVVAYDVSLSNNVEFVEPQSVPVEVSGESSVDFEIIEWGKD
ncbi:MULTISPECIES: hypothetical protein [unclassified Thermotoga]|uniref:DUF7305 domain-containing protein n=1 Tax=unclassified Thermotoga TaxID=2631113 RepID=UPI001E49D2FD|nr:MULTISPECIES: hypothetical protein [unclassified Thermotoga]